MKYLLTLLFLIGIARAQTVVTLSTADTSKIKRTTGTKNAELQVRQRDSSVANGIWYNSGKGFLRMANVGFGLGFASNTFKVDSTVIASKAYVQANYPFKSSTMYIGTTAHALNRASAAEGLSGITSLTPGANFTLNQNSVAAITSVNSGAVANSIYVTGGKVGIGLIAPSEKLHVQLDQNDGTRIRVENDNAGLLARSAYQAITDSAQVEIYAGSSTFATVLYDIPQSGWSGIGLLGKTLTSQKGLTIGTGSAYAPIVFGSATHERMRIYATMIGGGDSTGTAIGIGTRYALGYMLNVAGTGRFATSVTSPSFIGTATLATSLTGGAGGSIPYQSSASTTAMLANGTAGQVLTSAGTTLAPTWTTPSPGFTNPMTSLGDMIIGLAAGAPARMGLGSAGQILTVNGGATAPQWQSTADLTAGTGLSSTGVYNTSAARTFKADTAVLQTVLNFKPLGNTYWASKTAPFTITTPNTVANANGATISGSAVFRLNKVSATSPGILTTSTDTIAGNKKLTGVLTATTASFTSASSGTPGITVTGATDGTGAQITVNSSGNSPLALYQNGSGNIASYNTSGGEKSYISNTGVVGGLGFATLNSTFTSTITGQATSNRTWKLQNTSGTLADSAAVALKANIASPTFTGTVKMPNLTLTNISAGAVADSILTKNATTNVIGKILGTNANTASTVVERDASGNFSAGQVTSTAGIISSTDADLLLKKAAIGNYNQIAYLTAGVLKWQEGTNSGTNDWWLYNNAAGAAALTVNTTTSAATFAGALTVTGHTTFEGVTSTGATGTGKLVYDGTPTLVTPTIGVATATSINKMAITAPATSSTLAVADGKTLTASNTLTLAGTDATTMTFPSTSATIARTDAANTFTGVQTFTSPVVGTQSAGDNSTKAASTAYVDAADNLKANLASPTFTGTVVLPNSTITNAMIQTAVIGNAKLTNPGITIGSTAMNLGTTNTALTGMTTISMSGNLSLNTAGAKINITEGTNGSAGQVALVAGTKAITITGITTSTRAFVTMVSPGGTTLTTSYQAVCTSNTLTLQANVAAGTINTSDTSTLNYWVEN